MLDGMLSRAVHDRGDRDLGSAYIDPEESGHERVIPPPVIQIGPMDRRLATKNIRTGLIAGSISLVIFALSFLAGLVY